MEREKLKCFVTDGDGGAVSGEAEAAVDVINGAEKQGADVLRFERAEGENAKTGEEGAGEVERGVFGGGTEEDDGSVFNGGEEGVLLSFGESVDLVDEEDCACLGSGAPGFVDGAAEVDDSGGDGGEG